MAIAVRKSALTRRSSTVPLRSTGQLLSRGFVVLLRKSIPQNRNLKAAAELNVSNRMELSSMKILIFLLAIFSSSLCLSASPSKLPDRIFELPSAEKNEPSRTIDVLLLEATSLNDVLGHYPPAYNTESEREQTYSRWVDLVLDANVLGENSEELLFVHAQLYRQGHNMDVRHAAEKSSEYIQTCISKFPKSKKCHLEATYLYLQIGPPNIKLAKKSLDALSKMYGENLNEEVEAGYAFLYLYSRNSSAATKQINKYLKAFPSSSRAVMFNKILEGLKDGGIQVKSN